MPIATEGGLIGNEERGDGDYCMTCKNGHSLDNPSNWAVLKYGEKACALCAKKAARGK